MKTLHAAILVSLLGGSAMAFDTSRNPDKVPSIGISYSTQDGTDNQEVPVTLPSGQVVNAIGKQFSHDLNEFGMDLRMPVSNQLTLTIFGAGVRNAGSLGTASVGAYTIHETKIGAAARIYLQR